MNFDQVYVSKLNILTCKNCLEGTTFDIPGALEQLKQMKWNVAKYQLI